MLMSGTDYRESLRRLKPRVFIEGRTVESIADDPALGVWREAAWCHLLFAAGKYSAALVRLRAVTRDVTGVPLESASVPSDRAAAFSGAADLFARMKAAVTARCPAAFGRPVAA